ncbi:hypothetical protein ACP70R_001792 [Stipagrostis hirtigluma subsp. patula]
MPPWKGLKGAMEEATVSGGDRIGALPDALLHHILSFLPSREAVRTCLVARRWVDLWKSATALSIVGDDGKEPEPFDDVWEFVDHLLLLRGRSPIDTFELRVSGVAIDVGRVLLWIRHAVLCNVLQIQLCFADDPPVRPWPDGPALVVVSEHLTRLELRGLMFNDEFLNFSRCPSLQYLRIDYCNFLEANRISSQSLKHLTVSDKPALTSGLFVSFRTKV